MMSKRSWVFIGSVVPIVALFALLGWALAKSGGNPGGLGVNNDFGEVSISQVPARDFSLELLDGRILNLQQLRGKVVMVDFWASWCPPCRQEAPHVVEIYEEYKDQPVEFIGIAIWDSMDVTREFVRQFGISYPVGADARGVIAIDFGVSGIPEKYLISGDGVLTKKLVGPTTAEALRKVLDQLLLLEASRSGSSES